MRARGTRAPPAGLDRSRAGGARLKSSKSLLFVSALGLANLRSSGILAVPSLSMPPAQRRASSFAQMTDEYGNTPDPRFLPHLVKKGELTTPRLRELRHCDTTRHACSSRSTRLSRLTRRLTGCLPGPPYKAILLAALLCVVGSVLLILGVVALGGGLHTEVKGSARQLARACFCLSCSSADRSASARASRSHSLFWAPSRSVRVRGCQRPAEPCASSLLPGSWYVFVAVQAWRGVAGYSYEQLPE